MASVIRCRRRCCLFLLICTCLFALISKHACLAFVLVSRALRPLMITQQQHATMDREDKDEDSTSTTLTTTKRTTRTTTTPIDNDDKDGLPAQILLRQAQELREEALSLEKALNQSKIDKTKLEEEKVDHWIQELLFMPIVEAKKEMMNSNDDNNEVPVVSSATELLNTVERAVERLKDDRFSQEQVNKIFQRICETSPQKKQSRSNHSPVMALLLDAVGKLDDLDRQDNPNKRWSGRVEQELQQRLFAMDWNINLEDVEEEGRERRRPWKLW